MSAHEQERLSAYLDGELQPAERAAVAAHLAACSECAARLAEFAAVDEAAAALAAVAPSGYFDALPGRLRARLGSRPAARRLPAWTWAAAAALLLAVVTPLTLLRPAREAAPVAREVAASPPPAPRAERERDERRVVATPAPIAALPAQNAAPAPVRRESEPRFASAPTEGQPRPAAAAAGAAPMPGMLGRANPRTPPARDDTSAVAEDALEAPARRQATAASEEKAADAVAGVVAQAAPAAKAVESRAAGALAETVAKGDATGKDAEWQRLRAAQPKTAVEWRSLREELRRFAAEAPAGLHADAARVRTIEAGYAAWRAGGDAADEAVFRRDAASYLEREDAGNKLRVRELLR